MESEVKDIATSLFKNSYGKVDDFKLKMEAFRRYLVKNNISAKEFKIEFDQSNETDKYSGGEIDF